ncbi:MAG: hypothetical protein EXR94_07540 [Gemmatimonadetes bacterium]|nr:hypothetical protein [Gemmatimonadota bacterium]
MLINLLPDFLDILASSNREAAYYRYLESHRAILSAYWGNYVLDLESPHAAEVIATTLRADRTDLKALLQTVKISQQVEETIERATDALGIDRPTDVYLMVGVGAANAGELVVNGRGAAFICVEHFTGKVNPTTFGLGLSPELIPLWVAHELAHTVRYTSPTSESSLRQLVADNGGYYDYWVAAGRAPLREHLVNEGLAVHASRVLAPGHDLSDYFGYPKRQFQRMREFESFIRRAAHHDLDRSGIGLRLRFLSGGMTPGARLALGRVLPERSGYYLGYRMVEAMVAEHGLRTAIRMPAAAFEAADDAARDVRTA